MIDGDPYTKWETFPNIRETHWVVFVLKSPARFDGRSLRITLDSGITIPGHGLGRFRLSATNVADALIRAALRKDLKESEVADLSVALAKAHAQQGQIDAAVASFTEALHLTADRAAKVRIIAEAAPLVGVPEKLVEPQAQVLADLLMDADDKQFAAIYPKLKDRGEQLLPVLTGEMERNRLNVDLHLPDDAKEKLAKRQANAAVAMLRMNHPAMVWPLFQHSPDPRARSYLIHRLSPLGADAGAIVKQLDKAADPTIRRALLLSLGEFSDKDFTPDERMTLLPRLQEIYRTEADPGLHAASEWLLRTWKQEAWLNRVNDDWAEDKEMRDKRLASIQQFVAKDTARTPNQWYVNGQGQTMAVIPGPVEFVMGSPPTEAQRSDGETQHKKRIGRTFAIAVKEVTVEQFLRFSKGHPVSRQISPSSDCPVNNVSWYDAAAYCNWLSEQEGIPKEQWCYEPNEEGKYAQGMKMAANYLQRTGYRLPTEAEWEFSCRAGAATRFSFGESNELLPSYAWNSSNSQKTAWPVGSLKPNDLGLFDMHGIVWEWCQDALRPYGKGGDGKATEDVEEVRAEITNSKVRVVRGGALNWAVSELRSANRGNNEPTLRTNSRGIRPARTFPLAPLTAATPPATRPAPRPPASANHVPSAKPPFRNPQSQAYHQSNGK